MPLGLLIGPANAGKVALLLERYLGSLDLGLEPVLIVPNRSDVERVERDLLARRGALLGGFVGTFDELFSRLAAGDEARRPVVGDAQRALLVRRAIGRASLNGLARSARFAGFADALAATLGELESGLIEPADLDGDLAGLYGAYRAELEALGLWDRDLERRRAAERVERALDAWDGTPVFAYGFEDLTAAEWRLLEALAGRAEVTVSLPYEPGRAVFASLRRTADDLAALAQGRIEELPPRYGEYARPALAHLERALFEDEPPPPPPVEGALRLLEGAGTRGTLELVGEEILRLLRAGAPAGEIAVVCPSLERYRAPLETAFLALGVPYAVDGRVRLARVPYGRALLSLLRFAWLEGGRRDLYGFLRSPYSGLRREHVDYLEGRLRGRAVRRHELVEQETLRLRGQPLPLLEELRSAPSPLEGLRTVATAMLRGAHGLEAPPADEAGRLDLRGYEAVAGLVAELERWEGLAGRLPAEEVLGALERATIRAAGTDEPDRVAVLDLLRARTRRFEVVFVLGLEEGSLPRRSDSSPFLDDESRRALGESRAARLERPDPVSRARYLFYTACTRASRRLYLVREHASDEGASREPSPFWEEARSLFPASETRPRRRPLSALTHELEQAPTERERLRALASLAARDAPAADAVARANGWERRLERALSAFRRPTGIAGAAARRGLAERTTFAVTELETFSECSSMWLIERVVSPREIDGEVDVRLRGSLAHTTLSRFFSRLPRRLGEERVRPERLEEALAFLRECLEEAIAGVRLDLDDLGRRELEHGLWRDLEAFLRDEAHSELPLVPRRFEVSFGSDRSAPELQRGLDLGGFTVSGKIDRIDVDPFSARGIVVDYKSGKTAHSARRIETDGKLQVPLYMLVLRDLVGIEPLGGVYRALSGERRARGLLRADAREDGLPGFMRADYLDEETFWGVVEGAQERARSSVERIRAGEVAHDPRVAGCPPWCELAPLCRVPRP